MQIVMGTKCYMLHVILQTCHSVAFSHEEYYDAFKPRTPSASSYTPVDLNPARSKWRSADSIAPPCQQEGDYKSQHENEPNTRKKNDEIVDGTKDSTNNAAISLEEETPSNDHDPNEVIFFLSSPSYIAPK